MQTSSDLRPRENYVNGGGNLEFAAIWYALTSNTYSNWSVPDVFNASLLNERSFGPSGPTMTVFDKVPSFEYTTCEQSMRLGAQAWRHTCIP